MYITSPPRAPFALCPRVVERAGGQSPPSAARPLRPHQDVPTHAGMLNVRPRASLIGVVAPLCRGRSPSRPL